MITLFYAAHTCSLASHIALEEAGAEYSTVRISFAKEEQLKPDYLAINPKARVPSMITDKGILTETPAMLAFIAQSFPRHNRRRWTIPRCSPRCRPSTVIYARPCMSPTPIGCADIAGLTTLHRSKICSARCRNPLRPVTI